MLELPIATEIRKEQAGRKDSGFAQRNPRVDTCYGWPHRFKKHGSHPSRNQAGRSRVTEYKGKRRPCSLTLNAAVLSTPTPRPPASQSSRAGSDAWESVNSWRLLTSDVRGGGGDSVLPVPIETANAPHHLTLIRTVPLDQR
ncbi:hypothetical protein BHE74_00020025 [Ensete ventricosum]|nr:hypothetical protein BHE74_00020025 [Ensete ventricosum]